MVKAVGNAIHAVDPTADVVLGGMWGPRSAKGIVIPVRSYLKKLYSQPGVADAFDSIAMHPYAKSAHESLTQLKSARRAVVAAGDRKAGIWVTEIGWAAGGPKDEPYVKGRKGQARLLSRALGSYEKKERHLHLRAVFWYSWRDRAGGNGICAWCGNAGLFAKNGSPKPAWKAFSRLATR
jgi:exo-beta-1,3-glucanase (GH17 family)